MKAGKVFILGAVCVMTGLFTGCSTVQEISRVKPAPISPFIEKPELLTAQKATFPFHYFYLKPNAGTYEKVYIAPVNTKHLRENTNWAKLDQQLAEKVGSGIDRLAEEMRQTYKREFANNKGPRALKVVDSPNFKRTLIVETAIIAIKPTKAEMNLLGTAANVFLPGIGVITGHMASGTITIECIIRDAQTKEIIAMYANTEKDQHAILNLAGMTWYTSAEKNIRKQADYTARIFSGADYTYTHRYLTKIVEF